MEVLQELAEIARTQPEKLKEQRKKGIKVVGYTGRFVPEELIRASGAIPYLICKGGDAEPTDAVLPYMLRFMSPFVKAQIGYHLLGMDPIIPLLDLIVTQCDTCQMSRLADLFEYLKLPTERIGIPPDWGKTLSQDYYYRGLTRLKNKLEGLSGIKISEEKLRESIEPANKVGNLLNKINLLRREQPPPIGGYDFIRLNHYSFCCDLSQLAEKLSKLYEKLKICGSPFPQKAPRILLAGHVVAMGDYTVPKLIEDSGGVIVAEFLDEGIRHYKHEVKTAGDLMTNLIKTYYLERTPPSIFQPAWSKRLESINDILKDLNIDGVIWYQLSFDEVYDLECSIIAKSMARMKVPFLKLESSYEYAREATGPLATRIESFIQSIT